MRHVKSLQKAPFPQPDVVTKAVPAPTDGWDAISPLADMDPKRAPILTNWVPRPGWVELRQGYSFFVQGLPGAGPVESLFVLRQPSGQRMFAATNSAVYEVSSAGQQTLMASGFGSNRWQYTNFTPPGGTTVIQMVNGVNALQQFNGSTWSAPTITGFPNSWATSNIINIYASKQRLWYVMENSTIVAFMPVGNITGAIAGYQDLGTLFSRGGYLVAVVDWTIDGGEGPNAYTAFISSEGQVSLYQGIDPTNVALWNYVGTFDLSPPIGYRCATKLGSDVALITYQGLIPLSQALPYDPSADRSAALTARIQNQMNQWVQLASGNFGWQFITLPVQTLSFLNVPTTTNMTSVQAVQNMLTGAWTQFSGWNANCFELYNQQLYFGDSSGNVLLAYSGSSDGTNAILADMQCAFNWFDDPGRVKRMTMIQPLITSDGSLVPTLSVNVDFSSTAPITSTQGIAVGSKWDNAVWDGSIWSTGITQQTNWYSVEAIGKALAVRMTVNAIPIGASSQFDSALFDFAVFDGAGSSSGTATLQINAFNTIMELGAFI